MRGRKLVNAILDLTQTSLRQDPLVSEYEDRQYGPSVIKGTKNMDRTFVLMLVIFLIAQPSPVRLCFAATTQP